MNEKRNILYKKNIMTYETSKRKLLNLPEKKRKTHKENVLRLI